MKTTVDHPLHGEVESIWTLLSPWGTGLDQWFRSNPLPDMSLDDFTLRFDMGPPPAEWHGMYFADWLIAP